MTKPPKGLYVVAVVFFLTGLLFITQVLIYTFELLGVSLALNLGTIQWRLGAGLIGLGLILWGIFLLMRMRPASRWLMLGMTAFLAADLLVTPAAVKVLVSEPQLYLNRFALLLPMIASCIYLFRMKRSELS
jgi:hypothetical protein